eukprot:3569965-Alexandrium_andersonii.AAC.1
MAFSIGEGFPLRWRGLSTKGAELRALGRRHSVSQALEFFAGKKAFTQAKLAAGKVAISYELRDSATQNLLTTTGFLYALSLCLGSEGARAKLPSWACLVDLVRGSADFVVGRKLRFV